MATYYYIVEIQNREDGLANQTLTARQTLANALSYYYDRMSKMIATDIYPSVCFCVIDSDGNTIMPNRKIITQYVAPEPEPEPESETNEESENLESEGE